MGGEPSVAVAMLARARGDSPRGSIEACLALGFPVIEAPMPPRRAGKGRAILAAAKKARELGCDALITIDVEAWGDPSDIVRLAEAARTDWPCIVVGEFPPDGGEAPRPRAIRHGLRKFWLRLECGRNLPDALDGYRLYPVELLTSIGFLSRGGAFETEALVRGAWAGLPVLSATLGARPERAGENSWRFGSALDGLRSASLHSWLVIRAILPWPHPRLASRSSSDDGKGFREKAAAAMRSPLAFLRKLSLEHSGAGELAIAAGVGVAIGALPIIPFGIVTTIFVCSRLRLNALAAVGAGNICVFPFVPFLCVELGHAIRYGRLWTEFSWETIAIQIPQRVLEWLIGSLILGPVLGAVVALSVFAIIRALRG